MQRSDLMELNFKGLEMQTMKYTNRAENVDEENGVICWVIMFTPRVIVIKMSKIAHFFCWWQQKMSQKSSKIFKYNWKIFLSSFRK